MAANHQSWHISTLKNSSFKHHIYYSYSSHNTHMIHKSLSTTLNLHKASLQIFIYNIVTFQYYPRFSSQGLVRNRSQNTGNVRICHSAGRYGELYCSLGEAITSPSPWRVGFLAWRSVTVPSLWRVGLLAWRAMRGCSPWRATILAWRNGDRTGYGITNFFTKNPNFHHE